MLGLNKDLLGVILIDGLKSSIFMVSTCSLGVINRPSFSVRVGGAMFLNSSKESHASLLSHCQFFITLFWYSCSL